MPGVVVVVLGGDTVGGDRLAARILVPLTESVAVP